MQYLDDVSYFRFTAPQERDKALSELKGILQGFVSDREFHPQEIRELRAWQLDHQRLIASTDFRDLNDSISRALQDNRLEQSEVDEIRDLCDRASSQAPYFALITKALQELHGFLHGVLTDRVVKVEELRALTDWIEDHRLLSGLYPYNEIESLVLSALRDHKVDEGEQRLLQAFFSQFVSFASEQRAESKGSWLES